VYAGIIINNMSINYDIDLFADLTLSIKLLRIETNVTRVMIVDLDAHQGELNRTHII